MSRSGVETLGDHRVGLVVELGRLAAQRTRSLDGVADQERDDHEGGHGDQGELELKHEQHDHVHDDQQSDRDLRQELTDRAASALDLGGQRAEQLVRPFAHDERQVPMDDRGKALRAQTYCRLVLYARRVPRVGQEDALAKQDRHERQDQERPEGHRQAEGVEDAVESLPEHAGALGLTVLDVLKYRRQHACRDGLQHRQQDGERHKDEDLVGADGERAEQLPAGQQPAALASFGHRTPWPEGTSSAHGPPGSWSRAAIPWSLALV